MSGPAFLSAPSTAQAGSAENPHTAPSAARNSLLPVNWWQTTSPPDNWQTGDMLILIGT